jgi:hypothetical protein
LDRLTLADASIASSLACPPFSSPLFGWSDTPEEPSMSAWRASGQSVACAPLQEAARRFSAPQRSTVCTSEYT